MTFIICTFELPMGPGSSLSSSLSMELWDFNLELSQAPKSFPLGKPQFFLGGEADTNQNGWEARVLAVLTQCAV